MQKENTQVEMNKRQAIQFVVIDDDAVNNLIASEFIKATVPGANIETFVIPEKGVDFLIDHCSEEEPGKLVLFLDINMHGLSGWDVLDEIDKCNTAKKEKIKTFMLSSSVDLQDQRRVKEHHLVSGYITKFLSPEKIRAILPLIN